MTSLIGCCDSLILKPCAGSTSVGALMTTPGIGPATEGLSGVELFLASQAVSDSRSTPGMHVLMTNVRVMVHPRRTVNVRRQATGAVRAHALSAGCKRIYRGAGLLGSPSVEAPE